MEIRTIPEGAANAALLQPPSKVPAKMPAPAGSRYQMSEAHKKNCSMFMADFWSLIKMTYEREDTKQYWKELVLLADSLGKKYAGNPFTLKLPDILEAIKVCSALFVMSLPNCPDATRFLVAILV